MPDVFISYSAKDEKLARWLHKICEGLNISAFLASISITPGAKWKQVILNNLREAKWFFFLATPDSIESKNAKMEIDGAIVLNKNIIPLLYGVDFEELPGWIGDYQGIKIDGDDHSGLATILRSISKEKKVDGVMTGIIIAGFIAALLFAGRE